MKLLQLSSHVLVQALIDGLLYGGLLALVAVGVTLIFGVMKIINFAHGEFLMVGMYIAYFLVAGAGFNPYLTIVVTIPAVALMGVLIFKGTLSRILSDPPMNQIMLTLGIGMILRNLALLVFHGDVRTIRSEWPDAHFNLGDAVVGTPHVVAFAGAVCAALGIAYVLRRTDIGRGAIAAAQDATAAALVGVSVRRVYMFAFALGSATLGLAASLLVAYQGVTPTAGAYLGIMAFLVTVLGGIRSILGCFLAGLVIGLAADIGAAVFPGTLSQGFTLCIFILVLIFRPQGLLSRRQA